MDKTPSRCGTCDWTKVRLSGLVAAVPGDATRWHAYLVVEGLRTTDHRKFTAGALIWRDLPLPLLWHSEGNDHEDSTIVGAIDSIERQDETWIYAEGRWDTGDQATECARLVTDQMARFVSVDVEVLESEYIEIGSDPFEDDWLFWNLRADGALEYDWWEEYTSARIMGAHVVAFPAFPQAVIAPIGMTLEKVEPLGEVPSLEPGLMACASMAAPRAAAFANPRLAGPTPATIVGDELFGHLALWGTCHTGFTDACVCPPKSERGYAYAMTGRVVCDDGTEVPCGQITMETGHAPLAATHRAAASHYDDTGSAVADVAFGEDQWGIWFAGALRPGVTEDQRRVLRASALSGDWRTIGGSLELVAALAVNVPGFPIVASGAGRLPALIAGPQAGLAHGADGAVRQVSLVAAGMPNRDPLAPVKEELRAVRKTLAELERAVRPLRRLAIEAMAEQIG